MDQFDGLPVVIGWELTLTCDLYCRHCASSARLARPNELTSREAFELCDQLPDLLVQEVDFTGGEPLLRHDWESIANRLIHHGIDVQILTNGSSMNPSIAKRIRDSGIVAVGISLDGLAPSHDRLRACPGLFRRVLQAVACVLKEGLHLTVITTVHSGNLCELPSLFDLLPKIGIRSWQIQPIFPLGRSRNGPDLLLSEADYLKLGDFIQNHRPIAKEAGWDLGPADPCGYFTELDTRDTAWRGCPAGIATCGLTSDGRIKGCLSMPDQYTEGDLRQKSFWDIWFDPEAFSYRRRFALDRLGPSCQLCEKAQICQGGCSAMSIGSTGHFHDDPYCFYGISKRNQSNLSGNGRT